MARWSFFERQSDGKDKEAGEAFNPEDAEDKRRKFIQTYGKQLVVKIDGHEINPSQSLK